jgi:hypothetical protein
MRNYLVLCLCALLLVSPALAQYPTTDPNQSVVDSLTLRMNNVPQQVQSASAQAIGNSGPRMAYYWIVTNNTVGASSPAGPFILSNGPNTISASAAVSINWAPASGTTTSYDLLRTPTGTVPNGACNCAVATAVTGTSATDQAEALNAYTVSTINPASMAAVITNQGTSPGQSALQVLINGTAAGMVLPNQPNTFTAPQTFATVIGNNFIGPGTGLTGMAAALNIGGNAANATHSSNLPADLAAQSPAAPNAVTFTHVTTDRMSGPVGQVTAANFPRLMTTLQSYRQDLYPQVVIPGFGSSVACGAGLTTHATPIQYFTNSLINHLDPGLIYNWSTQNECQNGSVAYGFQLAVPSGYTQTAWAEFVATGLSPAVCVFAYGMNDFAVASFNSGETFPGFYSAFLGAIQTCKLAGADVVVLTSPHPAVVNGAVAMYAMPTGIDQTYPTSVTHPVSPSQLLPAYPGSGQHTSVITADFLGNGLGSITLDHRYLRGNQAMRQAALATGSVVIDAERYWMQCIQQYQISTGTAALAEAALFNSVSTNYVHPNDAGEACSYEAAIDDALAGMGRQSNQAAFESASTVNGTQLFYAGGATAIVTYSTVYNVAANGTVLVTFPNNSGGTLRVRTYQAGVASPGETNYNWVTHGGNLFWSASSGVGTTTYVESPASGSATLTLTLTTTFANTNYFMRIEVW